MATLTIHTPGETPGHDVEDIHLYFGHTPKAADVQAVVKLDDDQALAIAYDLLYQAVDAGKISGWNVQFPERDES